ncbi:hypothetical protein HDV05_001003 [Chytridiales sp. JEL 0842]|nr:hypothetical protein HDV05_001003 [Chytridiales sp. JEL 0842]
MPTTEPSDKAQKAQQRRLKYLSLLAPFPVKLASSKSKGRHLVSTSDLPAGSTVLTEIPTSWTLLKGAVDELCGCCLGPLPVNDQQRQQQEGEEGDGFKLAGAGAGSKKKGVVCKGCIKQMYYCSDKCMKLDEKRHGLECRILRDLPGITAMHKVDYGLFRLVLSLLVRRALEQQQQQQQQEVVWELQTVFGPEKKPTPFSCVMDLLSHKSYMSPPWLSAVQNGAEDLCTHLSTTPNLHPLLQQITPTEIIQLACRINSNSHSLTDPTSNTPTPVGVGMFPLVAMLNHSCRPNCVYVASEYGEMHVRTLRDVEEGEELCVSYVDLCASREERREKLLRGKHFWCTCERCEPTDSEERGWDAEWVLEGVVCAECLPENVVEGGEGDGPGSVNWRSIYVPPRQEEEEEEEEGERTWKCFHCGHACPEAEIKSFLQQADLAHKSACDFLSIDKRSALLSLQTFLRTFTHLQIPTTTTTSTTTPPPSQPRTLKLHPLHPLLLSTHSTLSNLHFSLLSLPLSIFHLRKVLESMSAWTLPSWPERTDYAYRLAEVLEIHARTLPEGREREGVLKEAMEVFEGCWRGRVVGCGEGHGRTVEVGMQVERLRRELER